MSTRSTIYDNDKEYGPANEKHELTINVYTDMHEPEGTIKFEIGCTTCHCLYEFIMAEHLGKQLAEQLKRGEKNESL